MKRRWLGAFLAAMTPAAGLAQPAPSAQPVSVVQAQSSTPYAALGAPTQPPTDLPPLTEAPTAGQFPGMLPPVPPPLSAPSTAIQPSPGAASTPPATSAPTMPAIPTAPTWDQYTGPTGPQMPPPPSQEELRQAALHDNHIGPQQLLWLRAEYLFWWLQDGPLKAPLATSGSLGVPGTRVLLGGEDLKFGTFNGGSLNGGMWLNGRHTVGVELSGFLLEQRGTGGAISSDPTGAIGGGVPELDRPFFRFLTPPSPISESTAATDNVFNVLQVASPGARAGSVAFVATSRLAGAEANLVRNLAACENYRVDMLAGFRFLELDEALGIETRINALSPDGVIVIGGQQQDGLPVFRQVAGVLIQEEFRARNQFYGGQLGLRGEYSLGRFSLGLEGKVAFGPNHEQVDVAGATTVTATLPGQMITRPIIASGLLAANSPTNIGGNIGRFVDDAFVIVPEVGVRAGLEVFPGVRVTAGYSFLYINNVMRPGDQIDLAVDPRLVPVALPPTAPAFGAQGGTGAPTFPFRKTEFIAHGVSVGLELTY